MQTTGGTNPPDMPSTVSSPGDSLPLYAQVAATLRTAIERGLYAPGARIPTEEELCRRFQVSRHTVRDALRQLRNEGLIVSTPGSRPTVAEPSSAEVEPLHATITSDFFDYMLDTRLVVEASEQEPISPALAAETGLPAGEEWLHLRGWRHDADDDHPTCWNDYLIRPAFAGLARMLPRHVGPLIPLIEDLSGERITRCPLRRPARSPSRRARRRSRCSPAARPPVARSSCSTARSMRQAPSPTRSTARSAPNSVVTVTRDVTISHRR